MDKKMLVEINKLGKKLRYDKTYLVDKNKIIAAKPCVVIAEDNKKVKQTAVIRILQPNFLKDNEYSFFVDSSDNLHKAVKKLNIEPVIYDDDLILDNGDDSFNYTIKILRDTSNTEDILYLNKARNYIKSTDVVSVGKYPMDVDYLNSLKKIDGFVMFNPENNLNEHIHIMFSREMFSFLKGAGNEIISATYEVYKDTSIHSYESSYVFILTVQCKKAINTMIFKTIDWKGALQYG